MVGLGMLHTLASLGPMDGWQQLIELGVWNAGFGNWYVAAIFWSFIAGPLMGLFGWAILRYGHGKPPLSRGMGGLLFATAMFGAVVWPVGGFWLVALVGLYVMVKVPKEHRG